MGHTDRDTSDANDDFTVNSLKTREKFFKNTWPSDENTCDNRKRKRQDNAIYRELYLISLDPLEKPWKNPSLAHKSKFDGCRICVYIGGLVQDCGNNIAKVLELMQSCWAIDLMTVMIG